MTDRTTTERADPPHAGCEHDRDDANHTTADFSTADDITADHVTADHMTGVAATVGVERVTDDEESSTLRRWALRSIEWYQRAAEGRPSPCRFFPSCSEYAHDAFTHHRPARAMWLTARRLSRCRPFGPSGFDPIPLPPGADRAGQQFTPGQMPSPGQKG